MHQASRPLSVHCTRCRPHWRRRFWVITSSYMTKCKLYVQTWPLDCPKHSPEQDLPNLLSAVLLVTCNSLPKTVTDSNSPATLKCRLKTFLFSLAYNCHWQYLPPAPLKLQLTGTIQIYYYYYNVTFTNCRTDQGQYTSTLTWHQIIHNHTNPNVCWVYSGFYPPNMKLKLGSSPPTPPSGSFKLLSISRKGKVLLRVEIWFRSSPLTKLPNPIFHSM